MPSLFAQKASQTAVQNMKRVRLGQTPMTHSVNKVQKVGEAPRPGTALFAIGEKPRE